MKKLSLDQLEVESFASQPSEDELTNVKGGTSLVCVDVVAGVVSAAAAAYGAYQAWQDDDDEPDGYSGATRTYEADSINYNTNVAYGVRITY